MAKGLMLMEHNYYMVRISDRIWEFAEKGVVAIGWSNLDLSKLTSDEAAEIVGRQDYYAGTAPQVVGKKKNEVWRFKHIKKGDIIIVPYWSNVLIAKSEGEYQFSEIDADADLANQLKVKYQRVGGSLRILPRSELSEGLSRRLRVRGSTVTDLYEFSAEIEMLFTNTEYTIEKSAADKNIALEESFKKRLITDIRVGNTHLITGGQGLETIVKLLFEIEGYSAKVLGKRTFSGYADADVEAKRRDTFTDTKILAQVKHHNWNTGEWGVEQLQLIKQSGEYADYKLVLITSGDVSEKIYKMAEENDISIVDGNDLADWIFVHLTELPKDIRARLHISDVPMFLE